MGKQRDSIDNDQKLFKVQSYPIRIFENYICFKFINGQINIYKRFQSFPTLLTKHAQSSMDVSKNNMSMYSQSSNDKSNLRYVQISNQGHQSSNENQTQNIITSQINQSNLLYSNYHGISDFSHSIDSQQYQKILQHQSSSHKSEQFSFSDQLSNTRKQKQADSSIQSYDHNDQFDFPLNASLQKQEPNPLNKSNVPNHKNTPKQKQADSSIQSYDHNDQFIFRLNESLKDMGSNHGPKTSSENLQKQERNHLKKINVLNLDEFNKSEKIQDSDAYSGLQESIQNLFIKKPQFMVSMSQNKVIKSHQENEISNESKRDFEEQVYEGKIIVDGIKIVNEEEMNKLNRYEQQFISQKSLQNIVPRETQISYILKLQRQQQRMKKLIQWKNRMFIEAILNRVQVQITEQNIKLYSDILLQTRIFSKKNSFVQGSAGLFTINLKQISQSYPIGNKLFVLINHCPKQLIIGIYLGPHLTQKMIQKIFSFDWPNLRIIKFYWSVRQTYLQDQVLLFKTENKNNFGFMQNVKSRRLIEEIQVKGNYFTDLMAESLSNICFPSLRKLTIDYDVLMSRQAFECLLSKKVINFKNAELYISYNKLTQLQLKKLIKEFKRTFSEQINLMTLEAPQDYQIDVRPYIQQLEDEWDDQDQIGQQNTRAFTNDFEQVKQFSLERNMIQLMENPNHLKDRLNSRIVDDTVEQDYSFTNDNKLILNEVFQEFNISEDKHGQSLINCQLSIIQQDLKQEEIKAEPLFIDNQQISESLVFEDDLNMPKKSQDPISQQQKQQIVQNYFIKISNKLQQIHLLNFNMHRFLYPQLYLEICSRVEHYFQQNQFFIALFVDQIQTIQIQQESQQRKQDISIINQIINVIEVNYSSNNYKNQQKLFDFNFHHIIFVAFLDINYIFFKSITQRNSLVKTKCPKINIGVVIKHKLNERLKQLSITGNYLPLYLVRDLRKIEFKSLKYFNFFFHQRFQPHIENILIPFFFQNIPSECKISLHCNLSQPYQHIFQSIIDYMIQNQLIQQTEYNSNYQNAKKLWKTKLYFKQYYKKSQKKHLLTKNYYDNYSEIDYCLYQRLVSIDFQQKIEFHQNFIRQYQDSAKLGQIQLFFDTNLKIIFLFYSAFKSLKPHSQIIQIIKNICLFVGGAVSQIRVQYLIWMTSRLNIIRQQTRYNFHYLQYVNKFCQQLSQIIVQLSCNSYCYVSLILAFLLQQNVHSPQIYRKFVVFILKSINLLVPNARYWIKSQIYLFVYKAFYANQRVMYLQRMQDKYLKQLSRVPIRDSKQPKWDLKLPIDEMNNKTNRKYVQTIFKFLKNHIHKESDPNKIVKEFMFKCEMFRDYWYPRRTKQKIIKKIKRYLEFKQTYGFQLFQQIKPGQGYSIQQMKT